MQLVNGVRYTAFALHMCSVYTLQTLQPLTPGFSCPHHGCAICKFGAAIEKQARTSPGTLQVQAVDGHDEEIQSDNEVAVGHDGRLRIVLSDVTSRFPAEQLPQVPDDVISKPAEAAGSFQLQRRGGQGRVCRSLLSAGSDTPNGTGLQAGNSLPADCNAQAAAMVKPAVRSSTRLQAGALAAPCPQAVESTASDSQSGICTRRQAKLNKRSSQQSPRQQVKLSHEAASSDVDFAVVGRSQHQGRAANLAPPTHLTSNLEPSRSEATNSCAQTGLAEKPSAVRRNRPRLQLNRKPKDMGNASQASTSSTSHTTQH